MGIDRSFADIDDLQGLQGDAIIDLYVLDLLPLDASIPPVDRFFRFVNWVVTDGVEVQYDGIRYVPIPLRASGFNIKTDGVPANPTLTVSNIGLEFTSLVNRWDDLVGAKLTRRRVLAKYLDSGASPDVNAHWPDEDWLIQQKEAEDKVQVTFVLSTAFDLDGVRLPKRRALRYTCPWIYRGEGCEYAGPPIADANNDYLTSSSDPVLNALYVAQSEFYAARDAYGAADKNLATAKNVTSDAQVEYDRWEAELSSPSYKFAEERYSFTNPAYYVSGGSGVWADSFVTLGTEYRQGARKTGDSLNGTYAIQRWARTYSVATATANRDQALVELQAAQADEATAQATFNTASADYNTKTANLNTAKADWVAAGSPVDRGVDVCGKKISSCKVRFETSDLPFGGFPGLRLS